MGKGANLLDPGEVLSKFCYFFSISFALFPFFYFLYFIIFLNTGAILLNLGRKTTEQAKQLNLGSCQEKGDGEEGAGKPYLLELESKTVGRSAMELASSFLADDAVVLGQE